MRFLLGLLLLIGLAAPVRAADDFALMMEQFLWKNRVLLLFMPDAQDKACRAQRDIIDNAAVVWKQRDTVRFVVVYDRFVQFEGRAQHALAARGFYSYFGVTPKECRVIMLGKDGELALSEPAPIELKPLLAVQVK